MLDIYRIQESLRACKEDGFVYYCYQSKKIVSLNKTCLTDTYGKVRVGKQLRNYFLI
jgi:hypothetical protein